MGLGVCFGKRKKAEPIPDYKTKVKFQGASPDGIANNMEAPETLSTKRGFDVQSIQFSNFFDLRNDKALENSQNLQKSVAQRPTSSVSDDFLGQRPKTEQTARPNSVDLLVNREEVEFDDPDVDDDNDDNNNKNDNENEESESESEVSYVSRNTEKSEKSNKSNKSEAKKRKSLTERIKSAVSRNSKVKSIEINNNNNNNKNSKKSDSAESKSSAITKTNTNINTNEQEDKDGHRNRVSKKRVGKHKVKKRVKVKRKKHRNLSNSETEQNGVKKEKKTKTKMTKEEIKEKMNNRENSEFDKKTARMTFDSINGDL